MMQLFLVAAFIPALGYAGFLAWLDRWEREPAHLLVSAFFWGLVPTAILTLLVATALDPMLASAGPDYAWLVEHTAIWQAPLLEEGFKAVGLLVILWRYRDHFDSILDGIVYGSLIGFGFSAIENLIYFGNGYAMSPFFMQTDQFQHMFLTRAVLFGTAHAVYASCTGIGIAVFRLNPDRPWRWLAPPVGLALGMALHAGHNAAATFGIREAIMALNWGALAVQFLVVLACLRRERVWIRRHLSPEVEAGILSDSQSSEIASVWGRLILDLRALGRGGLRAVVLRRRLHALGVRLAFRKHQQARLAEPHEREIESLRIELKELSAQLV